MSSSLVWSLACIVSLVSLPTADSFLVPTPLRVTLNSHAVKLRSDRLHSLVLHTANKDKTDFNIDDVTEEAEKALEAGKAALENTSKAPEPPKAPAPKVPMEPKAEAVKSKPATPVQASSKIDPDLQVDAVGAAVGSALLGGGLGIALLVQLPDLATSVDPAVPPLVGATLLAAGAYAVSIQDSRPGRITRNVIGKPTKAIGKAFVGSIQNAIDAAVASVLAIPGNIADAAQKQVERTTEEVKAIPTKVSDAAKRKAEETAAEVQALPGKVSEAAKRKAEQTAEEIKLIPQKVADAAVDAAEDIVEEIKATPSRVASSAQEAVTRTVDSTKQSIDKAVEDAKSFPTRKFNEVSALLEGETRDPDVPTPPKKPPPKPLVEEAKRQSMVPQPPKISLPKSPPKVEMPKIEAPKIEVPKVELPKVEVPKIELPNIDLKPPVSRSVSRPVDPAAEAKKQERAQAAKKQLAASAKQQAAAAEAKRKEQAAAIEAKKKEQAALAKKQAEARAAKQKAAQEAAAERKRAQESRAEEKAAQREAKRIRQENSKAAAEAKKQAQGNEQIAQEQQTLRRAEAALEKSRAAEAKRAAAAEKKKQQAEARQAAIAEKKKQEAEARQAAAEKKKQEAEARQEAAAQARQEKLAAAEKKKEEANARRAAAAAETKKGQMDTPPRPSFRIPQPSRSVRVANENVTPSRSVRVSASQKISPTRKKAPRGVPTIVKFRKRRDGGVSGRIYGSPNFKDGERIETSEISNGVIEPGAVVKTSSGSRYFLSDTVPETSEPFKGLLSAIPGATITLTRQAKEKDAKKALEAVTEAKPRSTFSLFGMGGQKDPVMVEPPKTSGSKRAPPRGVPTLRKWRKNRDGSVTGSIFGSPNFKQGEKVTTSPIKQGKLGSNEIVRTGSGSRYFLD